MELVGYTASFIMGITLGLMGGGGSILTVPILVYLFQVDATAATTSSLFIVGGVSIATALQYYRRRLLDVKVAIVFAIPSLLGVYLARNLLLPALPEVIVVPGAMQIEKGTFILIAFSILMIVASISMIRGRKQTPTSQENSKISVAVKGVVTGFITGFVGAGGGFMILPVLVNTLKLPMRVAVGTSLAIIAINSLFGFGISLLKFPVINWKLQFLVLFIAIIGSFAGAKVSSTIDEKKLKKYFGWFVLVVGLAILLERLVKA